MFLLRTRTPIPSIPKIKPASGNEGRGKLEYLSNN
jgi:hypothetical protein